MAARRWKRAGVASLLMVLCVGGCAAVPEEIQSAADASRPSAEEIDEDPWRLLPPGAVAYARTDAAIWTSDFADDLAAKMVEYVPLARDAGLEPKRDIQLVIGGFYATVQNDVAFVAQGRFDRAAVERSAKIRSSDGSSSVQVGTFASETIYVEHQAAMALLSNKTLVFGTQLGVRRVLEVVEERRMRRALPKWFEALLEQPGAHVQIGLDLDAQAVPAVLRTRLSFLNHLRAARLVGNYKGGGVNLAGALTFDTPGAAADAERRIEGAQEEIDRYRLLMRALKMPEPFRRIEGKATGKDAQFAIELEAEAVSFALSQGDALLSQVMEK